MTVNIRSKYSERKKTAKIVIIRKTDDELPNKSVSKIAIGFMIDGGAGNGIIHH